MNAATVDARGRPLHRGMITATVLVAAILQTLDNTIANVALPTMQGQLSATQDQISWVLTSYIVAAAIMTPVSGWLCARFGRKEVFALCVGGFTLTSALCGLAQTLPEVVLFRTLQGVCGAALMPVSQSILLDTYPPDQQAKAMSTWSFAAVIGPLVGPALGGWITDEYSWRWVFLINVPLGLLAFAGTLIYLPKLPSAKLRFDMLGFVLLGTAVGSFQLMLDRGEFKDWFESREIVVEAILAGLAAYLFVVHTATTPHPFLRRELTRDRNFMVGCIVVFMMGVSMFSVMSLLPPVEQHLLGRSPTTAGLVIGTRGIASLVGVYIVGKFAQRLNAPWAIFAGLGMTGWSYWILVDVSPQMDDSLVIWSSLIQGFGTAPIFVMVTAQAFATLPLSVRAEAASLFSLMRNLGASVGIAAMQAFFVRNAQILHAGLAEKLTPFNLQNLHPDVAAQLLSPDGLARANVLVTMQAEWVSYVSTFKLITIVTVLTMPLCFVFMWGRKPGAGRAAAAADTPVAAALAE